MSKAYTIPTAIAGVVAIADFVRIQKAIADCESGAGAFGGLCRPLMNGVFTSDLEYIIGALLLVLGVVWLFMQRNTTATIKESNV